MAGNKYSLAVMSDGNVWAWGFGATETPEELDAAGLFIDIATSHDHDQFARKEDRSVWYIRGDIWTVGDQFELPFPEVRLFNGGDEFFARLEDGTLYSNGQDMDARGLAGGRAFWRGERQGQQT